METLQLIGRLYDYNAWANRLTIASLKENPNAKGLRALSHLVLAEKEWLLRIKASQDAERQNFWHDLSLEECEALNEANQRDFAELLASLSEAGLDSSADYKNSRGHEFHTPFRDMLTHIALHSTYHRGQVASAIRAANGTPALTDYIVFQRLISESK